MGPGRRRRRYNAVMKQVRRVHMYLGLFLLPWVMIYGVSAVLLNHPDWFSGRRVTGLEGDLLGDLPAASEMASSVVAAMNEVGFGAGTGEPMRFEVAGGAGGGGAAYRNWFLFDAQTPEGARRVEVNPHTGRGVIKADAVAEAGDEPPAFQVLRGFQVEGVDAAAMSASVGESLDRSGVASDAVTMRGSPLVAFDVTDGTDRWHVTYNLRTGALLGEHVSEGPEIGARQFLIQLHRAHLYPPGKTMARWWWALLVDVIGIVMVVWALSGLLMWWQMKVVRVFGTVTLVGCVVVAAVLGWGMLGALG
jgi:hypothetical protein